MIYRRRGVLAALLLTAVASLALPAARTPALAGPDLAPGETVLSDGLTTEVRHATGSGAVAIEVWIRCPANGWSSSEPGIARLTALAVVNAKIGGASLQDAVRSRGGEIGVSIFQTATEFVVLAPADQGPVLEDALIHAVFRPSIDGAALDSARTRLAAEQAEAAQSTPEVLRDKAFSSVFTAGPLHDSTLGDPKFLQSASLIEVKAFASRSYVAGASAVIALGNGDADALKSALAASAPTAAAGAAIPASSVATPSSQPIAIADADVDAPGVALAWAGPPISDRRAATAMDFLSDYLTDPTNGAFAKAATAATPGVETDGQFVTLENPGLFFVSASGDGVVPATMIQSLRKTLDDLLARPMSKDRFSQAIAAYETRLLRQMDSPQGLADNYGWYFAQNAPSYTPSATDSSLGGDYFSAAASLTPDYVRDVAQRYLGATPIVITVTPQKASTASADGGS